MADVAFVVDASGSIRRERFPLVLSFIQSVIDQLDVHPSQTRVGAVYWSDNAFLQFDLGKLVWTSWLFYIHVSSYDITVTVSGYSKLPPNDVYIFDDRMSLSLLM